VAEKKTPVSKLSFDQAIGEVEDIVARLENAQTDVDELSGEVKRAVELIAACRQRLEKTDREVRDLVEQLQPEETAAATAPDAAGDDEPPLPDAAPDPEDKDLPF
jgi:exodeoxyribonuclease VII small subunit